MASFTGNPYTGDATLRSYSTTSFAACRAGSGTLSVISSSATSAGPQVDNTAGAFYFDRYVMPFNTSSLGSGASVSAGTLDVYVNLIGGYLAGYTHYLDLVAVNLASAPNIATGDWSNIVIGTACATRLSMADTTAGVTKTFTLNAAGLAAISATGYTTFAVVVGNDFTNSASSPVNLPLLGYTYMNCNTANAASNKPLLSLTYTGGATPSSPSRRRRPSGLYTR